MTTQALKVAEKNFLTGKVDKLPKVYRDLYKLCYTNRIQCDKLPFGNYLGSMNTLQHQLQFGSSNYGLTEPIIPTNFFLAFANFRPDKQKGRIAQFTSEVKRAKRFCSVFNAEILPYLPEVSL